MQTSRRWVLVELWMVLAIVEIPSNTQCKTFSLELLDTSTVEEETAVQEGVRDINAQLVANGSSFTLQLRNASKQSDLYTYSSSLVKSDVIALLDFNILPYSACTISTVTKIPVFRFHGSGSSKINTEYNSITLSADYVNYAQATIKILDTFRWKKIALMVESSRYYQAAFFESFTVNMDYTLSYIQIGHKNSDTHKNECSCERVMKELAATGADVVLLYATEKSTTLVMEGCDPKKNYIWIIQDSISLDVISARDSHMVVGFGMPTNNGAKWTSKMETFGLAYDAVMLVARTLARMHDNDSWLLGNGNATSLTNKENFYRYAKQMSINGHTSTVHFDAKGRRVIDELQILNLVNNTFIEVGKWSKHSIILQLTDRIRCNAGLLGSSTLRGRQISVVTIPIEPFVMMTVSEDGKATYHGFCIDLLNKLASDLQFTYKIKLVDDGFFGARIKGKWNGMIRELIDGKAEMIVASLARNVERQQHVAMTSSFMSYTDNLMMKKTFVEERKRFQFMSPFSISVWVVLAAIFVAVGLAMYVLNYFSPYGYKNDEGTETSEELNLPNSIWFAAACMLLQGADQTPKAISGRILAGFFWFSILVWVSTYTANLVAFFTVESFIIPVNNFEEAVESGYDLGVTEHSNLHSLFLNTEYDQYKRVWNRMNRKPLPKNISQAMERMRTGSYIHILDGPILDYIAMKEPCDLFTFPGLESPRSYVFALRQNDPDVKQISLAILHLRENGFIEKLRYKYWNSLKECHSKYTNRLKKKTIQLDSVTGVFIVLGVGLLVSFITLAIEIYWHRYGRQIISSLKEKTSNMRKRPERIVVGEDNKATKEDSTSTTISREHIRMDDMMV